MKLLWHKFDLIFHDELVIDDRQINNLDLTLWQQNWSCVYGKLVDTSDKRNYQELILVPSVTF